MSKKKEQKKIHPLGMYVNIFYRQRIDRQVKSKQFLVSLLREFAWDKDFFDDVLIKDLNKGNDYFDSLNLKEEKNIPGKFAGYANGSRALPEHLRHACYRKNDSTDDVDSRIDAFIMDHLDSERQKLVIIQVQELFQMIKVKKLTNEKLSELDSLIQENEIAEYFRETFQLILDAEYDSGVVTGDSVDNAVPSQPEKSADPASSKPIVLAHILPGKPVLFGRENELEKIEKIFEASNYVILTGMGGMGKSLVALAYSYKINESGNCIIQRVICDDNDSLREAINKLQFDDWSSDNDSNKSFELKIKTLQACKQPTLIILDNLNRQFKSDDLANFQKLIECRNIYFLITSRNKLIDNKQNVVEINTLDYDPLLGLYSYYRFTEPDEHRKYIDDNKEILKSMFDRVGNHTLMIELLAKLSINSGLHEYEINDRLTFSLDIPSDIVAVSKDGNYTEEPAKEIIEKIFSIFHLNETEKMIMRYMSLVPPGGMQLKLFNEWTGYTRQEIINLRRSSWIIMDESTFRIRLHALIAETIISMEETQQFYRNLRMMSNKTKKYKECRKYVKYKKYSHRERYVKFIGREKYNDILDKLKDIRDSLELNSHSWHEINRTLAHISNTIFIFGDKEVYDIIKKYDIIKSMKSEYRESFEYLYKMAQEYSESDESVYGIIKSQRMVTKSPAPKKW